MSTVSVQWQLNEWHILSHKKLCIYMFGFFFHSLLNWHSKLNSTLKIASILYIYCKMTREIHVWRVIPPRKLIFPKDVHHPRDIWYLWGNKSINFLLYQTTYNIIQNMSSSNCFLNFLKAITLWMFDFLSYILPFPSLIPITCI